MFLEFSKYYLIKINKQNETFYFLDFNKTTIRFIQ